MASEKVLERYPFSPYHDMIAFDEIWQRVLEREARQGDLSFSLRKIVSAEGGSSCHLGLTEVKAISTLKKKSLISLTYPL